MEMSHLQEESDKIHLMTTSWFSTGESLCKKIKHILFGVWQEYEHTAKQKLLTVFSLFPLSL